jgi:hypothetical protein
MMIGYDIYDRFTIRAFSIASKHDFDDLFFFARDSTITATEFWPSLVIPLT